MIQQQENIGLFFGSFNPIHIGHLILANHIVCSTDLDKIWFVVSPLNPFKKQASLLDNKTRYYLVTKAVEDNTKFACCDIEFSLPIPSYTINTLTELKNKYPLKNFSILMGGDNLQNFSCWKDYKTILDNYNIYVYPRQNTSTKSEFANNEHIHYVEAPLINISATYIRQLIYEGKDIQYLVPDKVLKEIYKSGLYRNKNKNIISNETFIS